MKNIAIIGAGGFGREVKMLIDQTNRVNKQWNIVGFYDDNISEGSLVNTIPVLGKVNAINSVEGELGIVAAIGNPSTKKKIISSIKNPKIFFPVLVHPSAIIGDDEVEIGEGTIICAGTIITANIEIGRHVIFNLSCTVGHDARIGDYCSFMPSVNISGQVTIGEGVYAGTGVKLINGIEIGEHVTIGAGAVVVKSLPRGCTAVGVPAKPIKVNEQ